MLHPAVADQLRKGTVIPAHPLALDTNRRLDERRQRALSRYYLAAGAGGLAVGVHTTQFAIHDPQVGLYEPVLALAADEMNRAGNRPLIRVAGILGPTSRAVHEAAVAEQLGYNMGLVSLGGMDQQTEEGLLEHCRAVAEILPVFGFYLQPAVGGRDLPYSFWRRFAEIENVVAIKIAAFDRYRTLDVVRAIVESQRDDIALYTGNDDNIIVDLVTPYRFRLEGNGEAQWVERRIVGGLLGQWAVWTARAVHLWEECRRCSNADNVPQDLLRAAVELTDANAALFDAANAFRGCLPGIHYALQRSGLMEVTACLDPDQVLSAGQMQEIDRVWNAYPHLRDDEFVAENLDPWLA